MYPDIAESEIIEVGVKFSADKGVEIGILLQVGHHPLQVFFKCRAQSIMAQTVVIQIDETKSSPRPEHGGNISYDVESSGTIVFQNEPDPDKIKRAVRLERFSYISDGEIKALRLVVILRIADSSRGDIDTETGPAGLYQSVQIVGGFSRAASEIPDPHPLVDTRPSGLLSHWRRIGLQFQTN